MSVIWTTTRERMKLTHQPHILIFDSSKTLMKGQNSDIKMGGEES